jgi:hypothetical protein
MYVTFITIKNNRILIICLFEWKIQIIGKYSTIIEKVYKLQKIILFPLNHIPVFHLSILKYY